MADPKAEKTEQAQLAEKLAAAEAKNAELEAVVKEQNEELEAADAAKKAKAPVITHKKKNYVVNAAKCQFRYEGEMVTVDVVDEDGKKTISAEHLDALLKIKGQQIVSLVK